MRDTPVIEGAADASGLRVGLVVSAYHRAVTGGLRDGAVEALRAAGARGAGTDGAGSVTIVEVPGAFEIPLAARRAAESGRFDAIACLGCIVRGETPHFDYLASAVAHAIAAASQATGVPMTFGVLTTNSLDEAAARAGDGPSNKGREAALAAVQLANVMGSLPGAPGPASRPCGPITPHDDVVGSLPGAPGPGRGSPGAAPAPGTGGRRPGGGR